MIKTILILFISMPMLAAGPKHSFKDSLLNDEIENIYKYVNTATILPFTKAQLQAMTPRRAGLLFFCTDCTVDGIVVSTGAVVGGVGRISARTTAVN